MNIPLCVLRTLASTSGTPLLKSVLRLHIDHDCKRPLKAVFEAELQGMQDRGLVMTKDNSLDPDDPYFLLDERGEAEVARQRL